jgi:UDP-N-acetylmuramyl pentapeptide synthase
VIRYAPAVLLGRAARFAARVRKPGGGSAVPGLVVNRIAPGFLPAVLDGFPEGLVVVTGSAGKSTTTKMLVAVLRAHGLRVFTNPSTANIAQGLTSALLERADLRGRIDADIAVLEMDEGHGARLAPRIRPRVVLLTNVVVDQIDRFFDPAMVARMLATIAARATGRVVLNADDRHVADIAVGLPAGVARWYGVSASVRDAAAGGLGYAADAEGGSERATTLVESTRGDVAVISADGERLDVRLPARGVHYAVDAAAAVSTARAVLAERFDAAVTASALSAIDPVFGRGEIVTVRGREVEFVLVQNPASYRLNIAEIPEGTEQIMLALGSDVRDPSYFWPVDTSVLGRVRVVSGSKAHEAALHLLYDGVVVDAVDEDLGRALDGFLALPEPVSGRKTIVFSADSMRRTRAHLQLVTNREETE